jgi:hypothetical protein
MQIKSSTGFFRMTKLSNYTEKQYQVKKFFSLLFLR